MKNLIVLLTMLLVGLGTEAQNARKEIKENILRSAGCYLAYPGPEQEALSHTRRIYSLLYQPLRAPRLTLSDWKTGLYRSTRHTGRG